MHEEEMGTVLWRENRSYSILLGSILLGVGIFFFIDFYFRTGGLSSQTVFLFWGFIVPLAVLMFILAASYLSVRPLIVTDRGIVTGTKYILSSNKPTQGVLMMNVFLWIFHRSRMIPWGEITRTGLTQLRFRIYIRRGGFSEIYQDYLWIKQTNGETMWIGISKSTKDCKTELKSLLETRSKQESS